MTPIEQNSIQASIDAFRKGAQSILGYKIHETAIWKFAHYESDTQWKRWKRGRLSPNSSAARTFTKILEMSPETFAEKIKEQSSRHGLGTFF
jgi:hypothetical protein